MSYGLKIDEHGNLVIPLYDKQLTIVGLQFIDPDGNKSFLLVPKKRLAFFFSVERYLMPRTVLTMQKDMQPQLLYTLTAPSLLSSLSTLTI